MSKDYPVCLCRNFNCIADVPISHEEYRYLIDQYNKIMPIRIVVQSPYCRTVYDEHGDGAAWKIIYRCDRYNLIARVARSNGGLLVYDDYRYATFDLVREIRQSILNMEADGVI